MNVIKRDKTIEIFNLEKIFSAVKRAFDSCNLTFSEDLKEQLASLYDPSEEITVSVEKIQDEIENTLLCQYPEVAKSYIIYRYNHKVIRENRDKLIKGLTKKLMAQDIENQNANVDEHSFGGRMGEASRIVTKDYALNYCMSRKARKNHLNNEVYIHDLDSYAVGMGNCITIPFSDLLSKGFTTRQTDIRPANSINTAFQLVAVIFQLQSLQQFGGVAANCLDWTMVPYVRKSFAKHYKDGMEFLMETQWENDEALEIDNEIYKSNESVYKYAMKLTERELKQSVEALYHNLVSLQSRSGNQLK